MTGLIKPSEYCTQCNRQKYAPVIAAIANQYGNSGVDKLPYNEHQFSMLSSTHIKEPTENSLCGFFS